MNEIPDLDSKIRIATQIDYFENMLEEQAKEISSLKKQINLLVVSREPKIGDRVILLDDESEGVIESLSIAGGPRINFDDGCYGNYTRIELITLFAYKESEWEMINGYKELTDKEISVINDIKQLANLIGQMVTEMEKTDGIDQRWLAIGKTDLQKGFMSVIRSIAKPNSF